MTTKLMVFKYYPYGSEFQHKNTALVSIYGIMCSGMIRLTIYIHSMCFISVDPVMIMENLNDGSQHYVIVTLNEFCQRDQEYTVLVSFGTTFPSMCQLVYGESVDIEPGESVRFDLYTSRIPQEPPYCANIFVNSTSGVVQSKLCMQVL